LAVDPRRQERLRIVLFYAIAALLAYLAYRIFEPFLAPLVWAAVLAVVTYSAHRRLARRFGRNTAAFISAIGVTLVLIVPMVFVLSAFVKEAVGAVQSIRLGVELGHYSWANRLWDRVQNKFPGLIPPDLGAVIHNYAEQTAAFIAARVGEILKHTAEFLVDLSFTILGMFYFFRDGDVIVARLQNSLPFEEAQRRLVVENTRSLIFATVISSLAAAAAHGVIGGLAFALTGIKTPIFWGVLMGFFSLIPLIGTALIWVPLSLSLILGGHLAAGIILAGICSLVIGMVDNVLRPLLISGRAQMSTLLIFIGVLGGIHVFGLLGVVLGPIIIATAAMLLNVYVPGTHTEHNASKAGGKAKAGVLE
jgi:predicted PurR-regulated permease PerM